MKTPERIVFFVDNGAENELWRVSVTIAFRPKSETYRLYLCGGEATRWHDCPHSAISKEDADAIIAADNFDEIVDVILGYLC